MTITQTPSHFVMVSQSEHRLISSADVVNLKGNNIIWYVIIICIICYSNVILKNSLVIISLTSIMDANSLNLTCMECRDCTDLMFGWNMRRILNHKACSELMIGADLFRTYLVVVFLSLQVSSSASVASRRANTSRTLRQKATTVWGYSTLATQVNICRGFSS